MLRRTNKNDITYTCLFCNRTFKATEVLFADEINNSRITAPDAVQSVFFSHDFVRGPKNVPTQLWHRWNTLNPKKCNFNHEEIPKIIEVRRADGRLPDAPLSKRVSAGDRSRTIAEEMLMQDGADRAAPPADAAQEQDSRLAMVLETIEPDEVTRLDKRICPHCHCIVPEGIGRLPVFRIAMLGGKASGKTTYMLLAANQIVQHSNRPSILGGELELAGGSLVGESALFFDEMFELSRVGKLPSTEMSEHKSVFPLVMRIEPFNRRIKPFFLILQDYPGEGMTNGNFMINTPGVLKADGAILLVDPEQMRVRMDYDGTDGLHEAACQETLEATCQKFRNNIEQFEKLREIIVALHKIDKLYQAMVTENPSERPSFGPLDEGSLKDAHSKKISADVLARIDKAVRHIFANLLKFAGDTNRVTEHFMYLLGCDYDNGPALSFKGVSAHTMVPNDTAFVSNMSLDNNGYGHRLLEPVLELLCHATLLPSDMADRKRHGLFQRASAEAGIR